MHFSELTARESRVLSEFLSHRKRPQGTLCSHELQDFLFAIACAPELIQPSEWLPLISDNEDIGFADMDEAQQILGPIMTLYNQYGRYRTQGGDAVCLRFSRENRRQLQ
jgi:yecA family protein